MNRRSALSMLGAAFLAAVLPPDPRGCTSRSVAGGAPRCRFIILRGTDHHGNPISEEIPWPEEGEEVASKHSYQEWSLTFPACGTTGSVPISFGWSA